MRPLALTKGWSRCGSLLATRCVGAITSTDEPKRFDVTTARPAIERASWVVLVLALLCAVFIYGLNLAISGAENIAHAPRALGNIRLLANIEPAVFVLATIVIGRFHPRADTIRALRDTAIGPFLPILMGVSFAILVWFVGSAPDYGEAGIGIDDFLITHSPGIVLAVAFPLIWMPLFPRMTAILAGLIAGPLIFAMFGHWFFEESLSHDDEGCGYGPFLFTLTAGHIAFVLLSRSHWLWLAPSVAVSAAFPFVSTLGTQETLLVLFAVTLAAFSLVTLWNRRRIEARPLTCAIVVGLLAAGLAAVGADFGSACGYFA